MHEPQLVRVTVKAFDTESQSDAWQCKHCGRLLDTREAFGRCDRIRVLPAWPVKKGAK